MELDNLFGLPAHPLLVHIPVVLVPLAAVIAVVLAVRPAWLDRFGWLLLAVTAVGAGGAVLAAGSGESLEHRVEESKALNRHVDLGETAKMVSVVFFLIVAGVVGFRWWSARRSAAGGGADIARSGVIAIITAVLLAGTGIGAGVTIAQAGHAGAEVSWSDVGPSNEGSGGDVDEDEDEDEDGDDD